MFLVNLFKLMLDLVETGICPLHVNHVHAFCLSKRLCQNVDNFIVMYVPIFTVPSIFSRLERKKSLAMKEFETTLDHSRNKRCIRQFPKTMYGRKAE